jgi:hypothetical protein
MKSLGLSLVVWLAAAALGRADLVIVQKTEGAGQAGDMTIKIKGDKARSDLAQPVSMITDGATGEMITLMHSGKTYLRVSAEQTKAMMEQLQKLRPGGEPAKLQPTGKKEKVGDYDCEIFTANLGGLIVTYWIAKDFPNYQSVLAQLEKFQSGAISAMGKGAMPELKDFPGMMIRTEMNMGGKKSVTTLVSAKEENVDPAVFKIPAGYKEVTSPALNFQPSP